MGRREDTKDTRIEGSPIVTYVQGWLVGVGNAGSSLIPYEIGMRCGTGARSYSGPISKDLVESFHLAAWAVDVCRSTGTDRLASYDLHLHFPLNHVDACGPSCRLSLANSLLQAWPEAARYEPLTTILLGDLTLQGDVLPVGRLEHKIEAARNAGLTRIVVPLASGRDYPGTVGVSSLHDLIASVSA